MKTKQIRNKCIECGRFVDEKSDCINVCSECLYGDEDNEEINGEKVE